MDNLPRLKIDGKIFSACFSEHWNLIWAQQYDTSREHFDQYAQCPRRFDCSMRLWPHQLPTVQPHDEPRIDRPYSINVVVSLNSCLRRGPTLFSQTRMELGEEEEIQRCCMFCFISLVRYIIYVRFFLDFFPAQGTSMYYVSRFLGFF